MIHLSIRTTISPSIIATGRCRGQILQDE